MNNPTTFLWVVTVFLWIWVSIGYKLYTKDALKVLNNPARFEPRYPNDGHTMYEAGCVLVFICNVVVFTPLTIGLTIYLLV